MVLTTLSTIEPLHRIHTILLDFSYHGLDETDCAQLDSTLSTLPLNPLPTVMFTDGYGRYEAARECFPRLMERNMVRTRSFWRMSSQGHLHAVASIYEYFT
jgi:hypothetical protein